MFDDAEECQLSGPIDELVPYSSSSGSTTARRAGLLEVVRAIYSVTGTSVVAPTTNVPVTSSFLARLGWGSMERPAERAESNT
jgi:hypothetical protein